MKSLEFLNNGSLFELKMSPAYLAKTAAPVNALAGMEFELVIPGYQSDEETEAELDYDEDGEEL